MGLGIAENHLMFATDVKLLERVMRGTTGTDRLADSAQYRRVASLFPEKTASISYSRQNTELKALLALLKSPGIEMISGLDLGSLVSKLPSYETIKKYMPSAGSYMQPDERGLKFTSFSLRREAE
jgi:hypothetical protein